MVGRHVALSESVSFKQDDCVARQEEGTWYRGPFRVGAKYQKSTSQMGASPWGGRSKAVRECFLKASYLARGPHIYDNKYFIVGLWVFVGPSWCGPRRWPGSRCSVLDPDWGAHGFASNPHGRGVLYPNSVPRRPDSACENVCLWQPKALAWEIRLGITKTSHPCLGAPTTWNTSLRAGCEGVADCGAIPSSLTIVV
jgi:hypothetical protein